MSDLLEHGPRRPPSRWPRRRVAVAVAAVVVLVAGGLAYQAARPQRGAHPSAPAETPATYVTRADGTLLPGVPASWRLYARSGAGMDGPGEVSVLRLGTDEVRRVRVPDPGSTGPVWFVAVNRGVLVRPIGPGRGYGVPDGGPVYRLRGALRRYGPALPGPRPSLVWASPDRDGTRLVLAYAGDGSRAGRPVHLPDGVLQVTSDGAGGLLVPTARGTVDVGPDGRRRRLDGAVLATGSGRWLLRRCPHRRCGLYVVDGSTGAARRLRAAAPPRPPLPEDAPPAGLLSPDGGTAVLAQDRDGTASTLHLLDLRSGDAYPTGVRVATRGGLADRVVWSPDSHWLFAVRDDGRLVVVDRGTRAAVVLAPFLPRCSQLAFAA